MYTQYLKPALRKIYGNKLYSLISIASLAVGMSACILIFGFIRFELGFDRHHPDAENTYRLNWSDSTDSRFATFYNTVPPVIAGGVGSIEDFARVGFREHTLTVGENEVRTDVAAVDDAWFSLFAYPPLRGDADTAVRDRGSVVLTEAAANLLFGSTDVLGATLTVDGTRDFRVGAVVANNPANSHLGFNVFVNIANLGALWGAPDLLERPGYINSDVLYAYVRLVPGSDSRQVETEIEDYIGTNLVPQYDQQVTLQALTDIHFNPDLQNEMPMVDGVLGTVKPLRKASDIFLFSSIAMLTLTIAAMNFMNMQAVRFTRQIREVGVRRVVGSSYPVLTLHFLTESALISLSALVLAVPLCELLGPWFYSLLGVPAADAQVLNVFTLPMFAIAAVLLGVLVSLYPALTTARMAPVLALRGEVSAGRNASALRAVLIVLQFTISIGLIVGTFTVKSQIDYALSKSLGFDPRNVVKVDIPQSATSAATYELFKSELLGLSGVSSVAAATGTPTRSLSDGAGFAQEGAAPGEVLATRSVTVSEDYFETLGMDMVAGRTLRAGDRKPLSSPEIALAAGGMVLNAAAARAAGWNDPAEALDRRFYQPQQVNGVSTLNEYTVVGVTADAHFGSVRRAVEPVSFTMPERFFPNVMLLRLTGADNGAVLAALDALWAEHMPGQPIRRSFLESDYQALYAGESRTFTLFIALATLAIMIACSGLYGLAAYVTERRTKEIGVRKVMGGSVWSIVLLFTNDFSRLVLLANLIAWPLAYFAMESWLQNFAYRIDLTPLVFIGSGAIALCIAWVTVGGTAAKAATQKPVLALRYE